MREEKSRVAIVDSAKELGGLCILHGCMPSKTLLYAGEICIWHTKALTLAYAYQRPKPTCQRCINERNTSYKNLQTIGKGNCRIRALTLYRQQAHFLSPNSIELDNGERLTADHFFIATDHRLLGLRYRV